MFYFAIIAVGLSVIFIELRCEQLYQLILTGTSSESREDVGYHNFRKHKKSFPNTHWPMGTFQISLNGLEWHCGWLVCAPAIFSFFPSMNMHSCCLSVCAEALQQALSILFLALKYRPTAILETAYFGKVIMLSHY